MRVLRWIVCCVFEGFLEVIVRHADHGDTLLTGYPVTRWRLVPIRLNPPGTWVVNERVAPLHQGYYARADLSSNYPGKK